MRSSDGTEIPQRVFDNLSRSDRRLIALYFNKHNYGLYGGVFAIFRDKYGLCVFQRTRNKPNAGHKSPPLSISFHVPISLQISAWCRTRVHVTLYTGATERFVRTCFYNLNLLYLFLYDLLLRSSAEFKSMMAVSLLKSAPNFRLIEIDAALSYIIRQLFRRVSGFLFIETSSF